MLNLPLVFDNMKGKVILYRSVIADCACYILMYYVILMMLNTVGKSGSIAVCVSPLASLMIDQKTNLLCKV